jgi:hypothetical protein
VENYAAEMGYTKAEAQEIRSGLNPQDDHSWSR